MFLASDVKVVVYVRLRWDRKITMCLVSKQFHCIWGKSTKRLRSSSLLSHTALRRMFAGFLSRSSVVLFLVLSAFLIRLPVSRPVLEQCVSESTTRLAEFSVFCIPDTRALESLSPCCALARYNTDKIRAPSLGCFSVAVVVAEFGTWVDRRRNLSTPARSCLLIVYALC